MAVSNFTVDKLYDRVPIGKATSNTALYVVDKQNRLAPVGVAGELCIAGRQVGKGYLNRPDLTADKFVPNPFNFNNDSDYAVMYRTGDIVRFLPDGNIDFVGRSDFQIKIRGFRVELTEIEGRIRAFSAITDAAVVAADAPGGGKCAVAYIVGDSVIDIDRLNGFIEEELPSYMVPAATMQVAQIPLNPNGKVDRRKLPAPIFTDSSASSAENTVRPLNDLEMQLSQIAAEILGHEQFGVTTNLLRAGLTSLSCIKLAAGIDEKFGFFVPVREIMKNPTLLGIENAVINMLLSHERTVGHDVPVVPQEKYPLTQSQMGVYYECVKNPDSVIYNIPVCVTINKDMEISALEKALSEIINAHPALRARLFMKGDEVWQSYTDETSHETESITVNEADMSEIKADFVRPFHLFDKPLFRVKICSTNEKLYLLLDFHHIVFDGASLNIFLTELAALLENPNHSLDKETFTYFDSALTEAEQKDSTEYTAAKNFFDKLIGKSDGASVIPFDNDSKENGISKTVCVRINKDSVTLKNTEVTAASLFLGAAGFVTSRFAGTKSVGIAAVSSGRNAPRFKNTMGMFVKTLPLVFDADSSKTAEAYLSAVQETMYEAIANDIYPYTQIVSDYDFRPQILFTYQGGLVALPEIFTLEELALDALKFPVALVVEETEMSYSINISYDSAKYDKQTMETYAECIAHIAVSFAAGGDNMLSSFSVANKKQTELVNSFSAPPEPLSIDTIHGLFEKRVAQNPDSTAVVAVDVSLSYCELNERANRVANTLIKLGVKPGDKVAFMLPRNSHVFTSLYGILKAGGVYIPVDPTNPPERIAYIIADADARFIITDGTNDLGNELDINELLTCDNTANPNLKTTPDSAAYIIYTSGTTGNPKGAMLTHSNAVNYTTPSQRNLFACEIVKIQATFLSLVTISFDAFMIGVFLPLSHGLKTVLATEEEVRNPVLLAKLCEKSGVDAFCTTPSVIAQYLESSEMRKVFTNVRVIESGGEKFPAWL
jgi:non-ribosomal peptide synthetase component F/aryl carrier-like protein